MTVCGNELVRASEKRTSLLIVHGLSACLPAMRVLTSSCPWGRPGLNQKTPWPPPPPEKKKECERASRAVPGVMVAEPTEANERRKWASNQATNNLLPQPLCLRTLRQVGSGGGEVGIHPSLLPCPSAHVKRETSKQVTGARPKVSSHHAAGSPGEWYAPSA